MAGLKRDRESLALKLNESSGSFKRSLWKQPKEGGLMVCRVIVHRDEESRGEFRAVCVSVCVCVCPHPHVCVFQTASLGPNVQTWWRIF